MKILVVDDSVDIVNLLDIYLKNDGYEVIKAYDGKEALDLIRLDKEIVLVIMDIMMPEMEGTEVVQIIRSEGYATPVILMSAKRKEDNDKIAGLTSGADDYILKPFNPLEVMARVKSLLRRQYRYSNEAEEISVDPATIEVGPLIINRDSHEVKTNQGKEVNLTALEFGILYLLASNPNKVYSAEEIFEEVWNQESIVSAKTVMVHVSHLRDKLSEATGGDKVVQTVWGVGYKIEG